MQKMSTKTKDTDPLFIERMHEIVTKMGGQNALSRASGVSLGSIQKALSGSEPTRMNLIRLAQASGVTLSWLAEGQELAQGTAEQKEQTSIPVHGLAESGKKNWLNIVSWDVKAELLPHDPNCFVIIAPNNHLAHEGIRSGFGCIISPATVPSVRDAAFVERHDGHAALRVIKDISEKSVTLTYRDNDSEQVETLNRNDIKQISVVYCVKRRL